MKFSEIPQFPTAHYRIDVPWRYLKETIEKERADSMTPLDLSPDYQRAHVWTEEQRVSYVEYVLMGGEVGKRLTLNCPGWMDDWRGPYELVDGKQRLRAALGFLDGEVMAFGTAHEEFEDRIILGLSFEWTVCTLETRAEILQLYLNINAGGTPHTAEELARVREMLKTPHQGGR